MAQQISANTAAGFVREVSDNVQSIARSCQLMVASSSLVNNESADRQATELVMHATQIVTSAETLLKVVNELKLARLMMNWQKQDEHVTEEMRRCEEQERADRDKLKRVADEVKELLFEVDLHVNGSRAKRIKSLV